MARASALVLAFAVTALLVAANGSAFRAQNTKLFGAVGPQFTITLKDGAGNRVTGVDPGIYDVEVQDLSEFHSFHVEGPGVNERTAVEFTGTVRWTVTFANGTYVYHCDPHPSLRGTFTAGTATSPPTTSANAITAKTKLVLTTGPRFTITLKTVAGTSFKSMKRGTYTITVRDRSRSHNAHLTAPGGVNRKTGIFFAGTVTWRVKLTTAGTLRYRCDAHAAEMRGSRKIV